MSAESHRDDRTAAAHLAGTQGGGASDLLSALRRRWWIVLLVTVAGTAASVGYAVSARPVFLADAVIGPGEKRESRPSALLSSLTGRGADLAAAMGITIAGSDATRLENLLRSRTLVHRVIQKGDLLPVLFEDRWNAGARSWRDDTLKPPTIWDGEKALRDRFRVKHDLKSGTITISCEANQVEIAIRIVKSALEELGLLVKEEELRKVGVTLGLVEEQLLRANDPIVVARLQNLMAEQVERKLLAEGADRFAFNVIDPPAGAEEKIRPRKKHIVAGGGLLSAVIGVLLALLIGLWRDPAPPVPVSNGRPMPP